MYKFRLRETLAPPGACATRGSGIERQFENYHNLLSLYNEVNEMLSVDSRSCFYQELFSFIKIRVAVCSKVNLTEWFLIITHSF